MKKQKTLITGLIAAIFTSTLLISCSQTEYSSVENKEIVSVESTDTKIDSVEKEDTSDKTTTSDKELEKEDTKKEDNNSSTSTTNIETDTTKKEGNSEISKESSKDKKPESTSTKTEKSMFDGYKIIEVDGGDLSGHREPNVAVNIGFGDREYWAFTNEHGQLVKVIADKIILQDDKTEPVKSNGRYYNDEAKVPGTERSDLDEGHVIADSLGGVSNAYNITPQNSTLNRYGDQAYMEKVIRQAGGCTNFVAIITYPNTTTQIPSHYSYTYTINGNIVKDEFDNVNPEGNNNTTDSNKSSASSNSSKNNTSSNSNKNNTSTTSNSSKSNSSSNSNKNNTTSTSNSSKNNTSSNSNKNNTSSTTSKNESTTSNSATVYWTPNGKSYHTTKNCPTLSRSKTILKGTIKQSGKYDPCDRCH